MRGRRSKRRKVRPYAGYPVPVWYRTSTRRTAASTSNVIRGLGSLAALWPRIYAVLNLVPKAAYACVVMYVFLLEVLYTQVLECELVLNFST